MQSLVSTELIFRRMIVKDWFGTTNTDKYWHFNKIIVRESVKFYYKCQIEHNAIYHSKEKQIEYLWKQYQTTINHINEVGGEAKKYIEAHKIDVTKVKEEYM